MAGCSLAAWPHPTTVDMRMELGGVDFGADGHWGKVEGGGSAGNHGWGKEKTMKRYDGSHDLVRG